MALITAENVAPPGAALNGSCRMLSVGKAADS